MKKALLLLVTTFLSTVAFAQDLPVLVKHIASDTVSGFGKHFLHTEEAFYFYAKDAESIGFWRSDGTIEGTFPLVSFPRSNAYEYLFLRYQPNICAVGEMIYFVGVDAANGVELWQTDGTTSGTKLFKDLVPGAAGSDPKYLYNLEGKLLFAAHALDELGSKEMYLWRSDGTAPTTVPVKKMPNLDSNEFRYSTHSSYDFTFTALNGEAFFSYNDTVVGEELWKTDGTEAGTVLVKDISPGKHSIGSYSSSPHNLTAIDGKIYFTATHPTYGTEPWVTDGTAEGTRMLIDLQAGYTSSDPRNFIKAGETIFFTANEPRTWSYNRLFMSDGTTTGTVLLADEHASDLKEFKGSLFYLNNKKLKIASPSTTETIIEFDAYPSIALVTDSILYLRVKGKLWRTDGSVEGTFIIDTPKGKATISSDYDAFEFREEVFFAAYEYTHGTELWKVVHVSKLLTGNVYLDLNQDGIRQDNEPGLANQKIQVEPDNIAIHTDAAGNFYWFGEPGNYTVTIQPDHKWDLSTSSPASYALTLPHAPEVSFGLSPTEPAQELAVNLTPSASSRCSFDVVYWLQYTNKGTLTANGQLTLKADARATLLESTPAATLGTDGSLNWDIQNLHPTQQRRVVVKFRMPDFNSMGDTLRFLSQATIPGTDVIAKDMLEQIILCSYDPNDKLVKPAGIEEEHYTLKNSWLDYTIRFQNTGNAEALTVVLRDTLDQNLDLSSLQILGSSHLMQASSTDRALEFRFEDINLPDSTSNEPESHGFVRYRIKAKAGVAENTVVENTAHIFFDFNPAIVTNTTFNTLVSKLPERVVNGMPVWEAKQVELYPNPSSRSNSITIESRQAFSNVIIYNSLGQPVLHQSWTTASTLQTLVVQNMRPGLYLVELVSGIQKVRKRLIIN